MRGELSCQNQRRIHSREGKKTKKTKTQNFLSLSGSSTDSPFSQPTQRKHPLSFLSASRAICPNETNKHWVAVQFGGSVGLFLQGQLPRCSDSLASAPAPSIFCRTHKLGCGRTCWLARSIMLSGSHRCRCEHCAPVCGPWPPATCRPGGTCNRKRRALGHEGAVGWAALT